MAFFNTKEEVIDIEITQHGKYLLSKGIWKPVYYEFYDDDVLYDSKYGGTSDLQSEINTRIKEIPRVKVQYSFNGVEERIKQQIKESRDLRANLQSSQTFNEELFIQNLQNQDNLANVKKTLHSNFLPLGNSSLDKNYYPNIKARFISGLISGSVENYTSSAGLPSNLNFIKLKDLEYKKFIDFSTESSRPPPDRIIFQDQAYVNIENEDIFLELVELNTENLKDNFEISLYKIEKIGEKEIEINLSFIEHQAPTKVVNNILVENEDYMLYNQNLLSDGFNMPEYSEFFLEVNVDKEIPENIICKYLSKEEINRLKIVEGYDISCEDDDESTVLINQPISVPIFEEDEEESQ